MDSKEKGVAMIELAVVLPFFVILLLGLIDVTFTIQKSQYLTVVTRELGNVSFRKCKDATTGSSTDKCLEESAKEVVSFLNDNNVIPGAEILIQSWDVPLSAFKTTGPTKLKGSYRVGKTLVSNFNMGVIMNLNSYDSNLRSTLITVEVLHKNSSNPFFSFSRDLYESVIF